MPDRNLLLRKLADIELYVDQIAEYSTLTVERYRTDWKTQRIVERTLQMAIEACLDVASHVIADRGLKIPATYAETFEILAANGLMDTDLRDAMVRMVGFRNVIVHEYARVQAEIVIDILSARLGDVRSFRQAAARWI